MKTFPFSRALAALAPFLVALSLALPGQAAPYAELLMDARTGEVLRSENADTRLHPASLTKMMTLYIAFEAVKRGEITLDTEVRISSHAASEPPSKLGVRAGQKIALRYLIRAAAVKSANDAATAIGEAIGGSVEGFAERMNRTAQAIGMKNTTFRNANGLTQSGHMSTARDMSLLGRQLLYDFPQYYNLFSRVTTDAGITRVRHTNRRLLTDYPGADGIKTGFTNAAGFTIVASAARGNKRVIATVFGGRSTAARNAQVVKLFEAGFAQIPETVTVRPPSPPVYNGATVPGATTPSRSMRPMARGDSYVGTLYAATAPDAGAALSAATAAATDEIVREVVTRASTSGPRYGISLQAQSTRSAADKLLLRTALQELDALDEALRRIDRTQGGFSPSFVGLSERDAERACARLRARDVNCDVMRSG